MRVMILAAGYGTRLQAIAENTPKPLLPINDKPLISYIFDRLAPLDSVSNVVIVTNNKFFESFRLWVEASDFPFSVDVVNDGTNSPEERLGSIGDIQCAIEKMSIDDDLIVVGGDNLFDFDLKAFQDFSRIHPESVSIGSYDIGSIQEAKLFGVVAVDEEGKVTAFDEKPDQPKSSLVAMCFYYFPKATIHLVGTYLKATKQADRAGDYIRWLCENNEVYSFQFKGKWYDIGSIESYHEAQKAF